MPARSRETLQGFSTGQRVRVVRGRNFQHFRSGDAGQLASVNEASGSCDVLFDGHDSAMTVASRYLEAEPMSADNSNCLTETPEASEGEDAQGRSPKLSRRSMQKRCGSGVLRDVKNAQGTTQYLNQTKATSFSCAHCGNVYMPDSIFCRHCGRKRTSSAPSTSVVGSRAIYVDAADALFDKLDTDKDGVISRVEFETAFTSNRKSSPRLRTHKVLSETASMRELRDAYGELRELILEEAKMRVAGTKEEADRETLQAHRGNGDIFERLKLEQKRLNQKHRDHLSMCQSLQSLKDRHVKAESSSAQGSRGEDKLDGVPTDWELSGLLPLTARMNALDEKLSMVDERLSILTTQVMPLSSRMDRLEGTTSQWQEHITSHETALNSIRHKVVSEAPRSPRTLVNEMKADWDVWQQKAKANQERALEVIRRELKADWDVRQQKTIADLEKALEAIRREVSAKALKSTVDDITYRFRQEDEEMKAELDNKMKQLSDRVDATARSLASTATSHGRIYLDATTSHSVASDHCNGARKSASHSPEDEEHCDTAVSPVRAVAAEQVARSSTPPSKLPCPHIPLTLAAGGLSALGISPCRQGATTPPRQASTCMSSLSPRWAAVGETCPACGNIYMSDALYCRKCGVIRFFGHHNPCRAATLGLPAAAAAIQQIHQVSGLGLPRQGFVT